MKKRFILFGREKIMSRDGSELYLDRLIIFRTPWFSLYLHKFYVSDDPVPHDHPWDFVTLPLVHGYWEHKYSFEKPCPDLYLDRNHATASWKEKLIFRYPFVPAFRRAEDLHWVELPKNKKPWSLCFLFRRRRHWGFVEECRTGEYIWIESDLWLYDDRRGAPKP